MNRILILFFTLVATTPTTVLAEENKLLGVWIGVGRASEAIYATMRITKAQISWGGGNPYNPPCKTTYSVISEETSDTYPGNSLPLRKGRTFTVFKLKLAPKDCAYKLGFFQFAIPSDAVGHADVITYSEDNRMNGSLSFSKREDEGDKQ